MVEYSGKLPRIPNRYKKGKTSDAIITFDIETTSLFHYKDGWRCFRPKLPPSAYDGLEKAAVPYIWMFGIETEHGYKAYYGREFEEVGDVLEKLGGHSQKRIIWVHNLAWEFQFLRDIIEDRGWSVVKMLASATRRPICFTLKEINIEFRCSYRLTNLSLAKAADEFAKTRKQTGDLIYTVPRSPKTPLTPKEMYYAECDVISLCEIIEHYRNEYDHLSKVPYTQTGEVRKELKGRMNPKTIYKIADMVPDTYVYLLLMRAFQGGLVHSSYIHTGKVIKNVLSGDMASAYPAACLMYKYPCSKWLKIPWQSCRQLNIEAWAVLYHVKFKGVESCLMNRYILRSKVISSEGDITSDNGRIITADCIEMVVTEIDMQIIEEAYHIKKIEYIESYCSRKDWLPKELIEYILDLYEYKTTLKNVKGKEDLYRRSKSRINSVYGCMVTNVLRQTTLYEENDWKNQPANLEFIEEKLNQLRKSRTNCFSYGHGIYVTAYTRRRTWSILSAIDGARVPFETASIYYDTDSCKAVDSPAFREAMKRSNEDCIKRMKKMCSDLGIDESRLCPADPDGVRHYLGLWEIDAEYSEFKTLGCKRYAHRSKKTNQLHITVSGVNSKKGVKALKDDIRKFRKNMVFDYQTSGKQISCYNDEQPVFSFNDKDGISYCSTQKHGIVLQPTTYNMTIDPFYESLWELEIDGKGILINE